MLLISDFLSKFLQELHVRTGGFAASTSTKISTLSSHHLEQASLLIFQNLTYKSADLEKTSSARACRGMLKQLVHNVLWTLLTRVLQGSVLSAAPFYTLPSPLNHLIATIYELNSNRLTLSQPCAARSAGQFFFSYLVGTMIGLDHWKNCKDHL